MPTAISTPEETLPTRLFWTRDECEFLENNGLLTPGKYEYIHGEIVFKMPQKYPHFRTITLLQEWLVSLFGFDYVLAQTTLSLSEDAMPEPDVFVISTSIDTLQRVPNADEVVLLIEVSDTTLRYDKTTKAALYATAGIPEYWVVDVVTREITVHRSPNTSTSTYASITTITATNQQTIASLIKPNDPAVVANLLP
jgi:Uma2 family endonuclease